VLGHSEGAVVAPMVAASDSLVAAAFRVGGNGDVTVRVFPGIDHFMIRTDGRDRGSDQRAGQIPPEVLGALTEWVVERLGPVRVDRRG